MEKEEEEGEAACLISIQTCMVRMCDIIVNRIFLSLQLIVDCCQVFYNIECVNMKLESYSRSLITA